MPELPEVETVARGLQRALVGRTIVAVDVRWARSLMGFEPAAFAERLVGRTVAEVGRRGKWLVLKLASGGALLVHLRMTGRLLMERDRCGDEPHARVRFALDDGRTLCFHDARKFGRLVLVSEPSAHLGPLGVEPLSDEFTLERLRGLLAGRRTRIKPLLLDQRVLAGLGNIYTDEALWRAGIHPLRRAASLTDDEQVRLYAAIRAVLREAVVREGTTLSDQGYVGSDGRPGSFSEQLAVYGRAGSACPRCGAAVERIVVGQRGTHVCPACQPPPEAARGA